MFKKIILIFIIIFSGCSSIVNKNRVILPKNQKFECKNVNRVDFARPPQQRPAFHFLDEMLFAAVFQVVNEKSISPLGRAAVTMAFSIETARD